MIKKYNDISLAVGIPGLLIQLYGTFSEMQMISIIGSLIFIVGLAFYAKSKARHPANGLLGFLSIFGLIILAFMQDKSPDAGTTGISLFTKLCLGLLITVVFMVILIPMFAGN